VGILIEKLQQTLDFRKTLILVVLLLGLLALNDQWQRGLTNDLEDKRDELSESMSLLDSHADYQELASEIENLKSIKANQAEYANWMDSIPPMVQEHKLILRQVRPIGIVEQGKKREEKLFLQVDGNIEGLIELLHHMASLEMPVYVNRYLITTRSIGTGFVSVELVLSRLLL